MDGWSVPPWDNTLHAADAIVLSFKRPHPHLVSPAQCSPAHPAVQASAPKRATSDRRCLLYVVHRTTQVVTCQLARPCTAEAAPQSRLVDCEHCADRVQLSTTSALRPLRSPTQRTGLRRRRRLTRARLCGCRLLRCSTMAPAQARRTPARPPPPPPPPPHKHYPSYPDRFACAALPLQRLVLPLMLPSFEPCAMADPFSIDASRVHIDHTGQYSRDRTISVPRSHSPTRTRMHACTHARMHTGRHARVHTRALAHTNTPAHAQSVDALTHRTRCYGGARDSVQMRRCSRWQRCRQIMRALRSCARFCLASKALRCAQARQR